jgi:hypothetical protein
MKPFGEHPDLISGFKNLRKLQAGGISMIETKVERKKYDYRANSKKLLRKTFGSTRITYSTSDEQVEESHYKPGGTVTAALGNWASRVLRCGKISTVKLLPLPQSSLYARTNARTNPSAQRSTQLRSVLARVYAVSRQNQITSTVP